MTDDIHCNSTVHNHDEFDDTIDKSDYYKRLGRQKFYVTLHHWSILEHIYKLALCTETHHASANHSKPKLYGCYTITVDKDIFLIYYRRLYF